jgi:hypothetical protein
VTYAPRLSKAYLANERLNIPDLWWRQEWMCEFVELGQVVFRYDDLVSMMSDTVMPLYGANGEVMQDNTILHDDIPTLALQD